MEKLIKLKKKKKIKECGFKEYSKLLYDEIIELRKKYEIAKDLSTLIQRSTYDKGWYYGFIIFVITFLVLSSLLDLSYLGRTY